MASHSRRPLSILMLHTILVILSYGIQICSGLKQETEALLEFKKQIVDPSNYLESWKDASSPCQFYGVVCDHKTGLVTEISLDNKSLSGVISPSLSVLGNLTSLSFPSNFLSGSLPVELSNCINLRVLNVSNNYLNGTIPDFSGVKSLQILDLADNEFTGSFPVWIGNLTDLVQLSLGDNNFDEGEIPESLGKLKKLSLLYLAGSNLRGVIPETIFDLEELETLDICKNRISGKFPSSIGKLKKIIKIELYQNNLTGLLPIELANLTLLEEFDISANQMYGSIPAQIANLSKLTVFHLFKNNFSGEIPSAFGVLHHLIDFSVYRNNFSGEFPQNLGLFSPLNIIDISENQFTGPFPKYLCQNGNLHFLLALQNNFSGVLPDTYAKCKPLKRFRINENRLDGVIPEGVFSLPSLEVLDFSNNGFTGGISPAIASAVQLNELMLSNNRFSGDLPKEIGKLSNLERIYLDNNSFSGRIPSEIGALMQISSLHLEENEFNGPIPSELAGCSRLVDLSLAKNSLTGYIPSSFSKMVSLNSLNLSRNSLSGSIPRDFDKLKLSSVDLSDNSLFGSVPSYFLTMSGYKAFLGNRGLCIEANGENSQNLTNSGLKLCDENTTSKNFMQSKTLLACLLLLIFASILVGLLLYSFRRDARGNSLCDERGIDSDWKLENYQKVELDVDEILYNVDEDNLIGSGSTGKVYKLNLKKGRGTLAVKQLWKENGVKLMSAEMEILKNIRHRNILKLYACLMKQGSNFLILEYMENGNLFEVLHQQIKDGKPELDWFQRYRVALGTAKGIAYLHHDCNPPIIHRDLKSSNILLDQDYEAKIADFGVAKVKASQGSESSCFAGTYGYIAPETAYSVKVTEKNDVYSFGVVLLELVTGKRAIWDDNGEDRDLVHWVWAQLNSREDMVNILDEKVASTMVQEDMMKVLKIATMCTAKLPNLRPSMKQVVKMLVDAEPCSFKSPPAINAKGLT